MKKNRSRQEQAIALSRVAAAVRLQSHRPKVQESAKQFKRAKEKRRWQHDQDGAFLFSRHPCPTAFTDRDTGPGEP